MSLLTNEQLDLLIENGEKIAKDESAKTPPVVYLHFPWNPPSSWMLAYVEPNNHDMAFGLMRLAGGRPELGYVSIKELESLRGYEDRSVFHDSLFKDADPLCVTEYASIARELGQIALQFTERVTREDL